MKCVQMQIYRQLSPIVLYSSTSTAKRCGKVIDWRIAEIPRGSLHFTTLTLIIPT